MTHRENGTTPSAPSETLLDEIAQLICGYNFNELGDPNAKATVVKLAILAEMRSDTRDVALWFSKSRLFDGLP